MGNEGVCGATAESGLEDRCPRGTRRGEVDRLGQAGHVGVIEAEAIVETGGDAQTSVIEAATQVG